MTPDSSNHQPGLLPGKLRLDRLLVARGLVPTRTRAQERILNGAVTVDGLPVLRASQAVAESAVIHVTPDPEAFVGRGGTKLAAALDAWKIDLTGRLCLDIGTSSGGFAECMLRRGAAGVIGIDSGHDQLAASLRGDPRLQLREGTNARYLRPGDLPAGISVLTIEVSFIAASLVLPAVVGAAFSLDASAAPQEAVILVKPQFEAGREFVSRGGVVRDARGHRRAVERVQAAVQPLGAKAVATIDSPIQGGDGNREFLLYARF